MARIPANAWVLVGDGEKALILKNDGDEAFPNLSVVRQLEHESLPQREEGRDDPNGDKANGANTNAPVETDYHRLEKARFAKEMAERLYKAAHRNSYKDLVIALPPHTLGELRKALHKEVQGRVVLELAKELVNHPVYEIERVLSEA